MEQSGMAPIGGRLGRLIGRAVPWVLGLATFGFSFAAPMIPPAVTASDSGPPVWPGSMRAVLVMFALAIGGGVAAWMARRRRWPLFVLAVVAWIALSMWAAGVVAVYYAGTSLRRRAELVAFTVAAVCVVDSPILVGLVRTDDVHNVPAPEVLIILPALCVGLPLMVGLWAKARRQVLAGFRERAERLEREQASHAQRARTEERARIAREMHDVVAHRVSLMVLHAGALEVNAADQRTADGAALIRTTGREALAELREVLGVLRAPPTTGPSTPLPAAGPVHPFPAVHPLPAAGPGFGDPVSAPARPLPAVPVAAGPDPRAGEARLDPQPVLADLDRLLDQSRTAGVRVRRRDDGPVRPLSVTVERTAYRVVQEALTNVHKHAGDVPTEVVLRYRPDSLEIAVRNAPPVRPVEALPGSGYGLVGLSERVELLGGRFGIQRGLDGGFTVLAWLPAPAVEALG